MTFKNMHGLTQPHPQPLTMATSNAPVIVNVVGAIIEVTATSDGQMRDSSNQQNGNSQLVVGPWWTFRQMILTF